MKYNVSPEVLPLLNDKIISNDNKNVGEEKDKQVSKQTDGTTGKKIILGIFAVPMILLNISLNAVQSVGRRVAELLMASTIGVVYCFVMGVISGFVIPMMLFEPQGWIGEGLCCLAGLFSAVIVGVISTVSVIYDIALEILKTPFLWTVPVCSWIYNGFVGFKRLFKSIGENELFVSNRYQNLGYDQEAQEKQPIIKKIASMGVPEKDEKAQPVSFTQAAVRYTLGVADVKSEDELIKIQKVQGTEYTVKPKLFPYRTGGFMIY